MGRTDVVAELRRGGSLFSQARELDDGGRGLNRCRVETTGLPPVCTADAIERLTAPALTSTGGTRTIRTSTIKNFDSTHLMQQVLPARGAGADR